MEVQNDKDEENEEKSNNKQPYPPNNNTSNRNLRKCSLGCNSNTATSSCASRQACS